MSGTTSLPPFEVLEHVTDVHCHPTDSPIPDDIMDSLKIKVCSMATRADDQEKVKELARKWPDKVTPCFGWHPWFSHQITILDPPPGKREHYLSVLFSGKDPSAEAEAFEETLVNLPEPRTLSSLIAEIRANLVEFPNALLGEVGLDRTFRIPFVPYPAPAEQRKRLTPFKVKPDHQLAILEAQLDLAVELRRPVSLHSVGSSQLTLDLLKNTKKKYKEAFGEISIDLHSCGFSAETWKSVEKAYPNVFLSLSVAINGRSPGHEELIQKASPDRILAESDYHDIQLSTDATWEMILMIARIRGWKVESEWNNHDKDEESWGVVRRLERNWERFIGGGLGLVQPRQSRRARRLNRPEWEDSSEGENE
ncbi:hypothetical protein FRC02_011816 [Tulasnella sp. 418]|nr:hypothetical protein FRC02_011816 [Tulasnella sp. 418]